LCGLRPSLWSLSHPRFRVLSLPSLSVLAGMLRDEHQLGSAGVIATEKKGQRHTACSVFLSLLLPLGFLLGKPCCLDPFALSLFNSLELLLILYSSA
jgi:hypothetical protein